MVRKLDILIVDEDKTPFGDWFELFDQYSLSYTFTDSVEKANEILTSDSPKIVFTGHFNGFPNHESIAIRFSEVLLFKNSEIYLVVDQMPTGTGLYTLSTLGFKDFLKRPVSIDSLLEILDRNGYLNFESEAA